MRMMIVDKVCKEGAKFTRPARPMRSIGVPGVSYSTSLNQGSLYLFTILINLNIMGSSIKKIWCLTSISAA